MLPQQHIHLLMAGLDTYGHTLNDTYEGRSETLWQNLAKRSAKIEYIYDGKGAVRYISFCNTPPEKYELIEPYGEKLMEKKRLFKANPSLKPNKSSWHPYANENIIREGKLMDMKRPKRVYSRDKFEDIIIEPVPH